MTCTIPGCQAQALSDLTVCAPHLEASDRYTVDVSLFAQGWFPIRHGQRLVAIVRGEELAQRMVVLLNEPERPAEAPTP